MRTILFADYQISLYTLFVSNPNLKEVNVVKACIYCKTAIDESSVVDVCRRCGIGVWGESMFNTIIQNMESARDTGDLYQGSVSNESVGDVEAKKQSLSLVDDSMKTNEKPPGSFFA